MFARFAASAALACVFAFAPAAFAHEGHDHETAAAPIAGQAPRAEAVSAEFELLAIARDGVLEIYLDRFATNEPAAGATLQVETPEGTRTAASAGHGFYRLAAPWTSKPGAHDLIFTVGASGTMDILSTTLVVPQPAAAAPALASKPAPASPSAPWLVALSLLAGAAIPLALSNRRKFVAPALALGLLAAFGAARLLAHEGHDDEAAPVIGESARVLGNGQTFLPKPTQRILSVRTSLSEAKSHPRTIELPGRVIADPNASGLVQAAAAGRLSPPPQGFPNLGARVRKGDVLGFVTTPFLAIDQSTMRQQAGDLDQQISIVERRVARYETLARSNAVARATLDDARLELAGLRQRRQEIERAKRAPEPLVAPVDGVIAAVNAVAGQIAEPNAVVFQIVDPARLRVEALALDVRAFAERASARTADGAALALRFVGLGLAERNQAAPAHFSVEPKDAENLRLGQFVTVSAEIGGERVGVAMPRASVVRRSNGETIVYEHARAEIFRPRVVRAEPLDAERMLIVAGVENGLRLVGDGAELVDQIR